MLTLNNLQSPKGAMKNNKRIGRGQGSGQGTQAGKGHKGQKARKSGHVRTGFEGNNLPLYMRLPKRGFNNSVFGDKFAEVTTIQIAKKFSSSSVVSRETLIACGLLSGVLKSAKIKVIGNEKVPMNLKFVGISAFSKAAREVIVSSQGSIE